MKKNKDIIYGDIEITQEELLNPKIRINTWIDLDVIEALKLRAKREGTKYQTLLNKILRQTVLDKQDPIAEIMKRLESLEKKVG